MPRDAEGSTAAGGLTIRELDTADYDAWGAFVRSSPSGSPYNLPSYVEALCEAAGGRAIVLVAFKGNAIAGGLTLYERASPLGRYVAPRLLLYYNGFVLPAYATRYPSERSAREVQTLSALAGALVDRGYQRVELRSRSPIADARPLLDRAWRVEPSYSYVMPLGDLDAQWQRIERNLRRLIERGRSHGLELVVDEDFDAFFELHAGTHRRKGAPLYLEREAFRRYYDRLSREGLCHLFHARDPAGHIVASQLVLVGHPVTHTVAAGANPEFQRLGSSPFLRWHVLEWLAQRGYEANDLTDASLGSVSHFKSQLGAELVMALVASAPLGARFRARDAVHRLVSRPGRRS